MIDAWKNAILEAGRKLWDLDLSGEEFEPLLEPPSDPKHGDATCGTCMRLAKQLRKPPRKIAEELVVHLKERKLPHVDTIEIAGAGFVNFRASDEYYLDLIASTRKAGDSFGRSSTGKGTKILVEFTSANPTGPIHIAHARQAAVGDSLCNILKATGYEVGRDYYLNDAGNQVDMLAQSIYARYRQLADEKHPFPEKGYHGEYIKEFAKELRDREGDRWDAMEPDQAVAEIRPIGMNGQLVTIRKDLEDFRVHFDTWYSEQKLRDGGRVGKIIEEFKARGLTCEKDGALFLKATDLGERQDWVLVKSDGSYTYRVPDFAYHLHKFERGFTQVVDLFGPDHHAAAILMDRVMKAFGHDGLRVVLIQHCRLLRGETEIKMSKRTGSIVTLRELTEEVGVDAARYFFTMRRTSSHMDFDIEIAKKQTLENPVYYLQNAHARVCNLWKKGVEKGLIPETEIKDALWTGSLKGAKLGPHEISVLRHIPKFTRTLEGAARDLEPSRLCTYLYELAGAFHHYYQNKENVVLCEDDTTRRGRMGMAACVQIVLKNGLSLLGVGAPTWMNKLEAE